MPAAPPTREEVATADPSYTCESFVVGECGFPGVCAAGHTAVAGEACLADNNCVDGTICYVVGQPRAPSGTPGFSCVGNSQNCYLGPWPGLCGPPGLVPSYGACTTTSECSPGNLCDRNGICTPRWTYGLGVPCTEFGLDSQVDDFCQIGLTCQPGGPPRCG
jgi:hypothetical protein